MWVEGGDIQDELFDQLGAVLTAPGDLALTPSAAELETLAAAVAARWPAEGRAPVSSPAVHQLRRPGTRPLRRLGASAWRAGSAAAAIVVFSASAAAAAGGGVPLPRPVRVVAYTVGLPVDSPALDDTHHHIKEMQEAVKANDKPKAEAAARRLRTDLAKVPADEKKEAEQKVVAVMVQAAPLIQAPAPTTAPPGPAPSSTTATAPGSSTTATTVAAEEKAPVTTTTAPPGTTTTTAPDSTTTTTTTTTTTVPPADETPSGDGNPSGDPGADDPGPGVEDPSTTPTTTPDGGTTTTTAPASGGTGGEETTTTTTSSTTTTTSPVDPGTGARP